jgi:hypothetical protein
VKVKLEDIREVEYNPQWFNTPEQYSTPPENPDESDSPDAKAS